MTTACIHGFSWDVACAMCNRLGQVTLSASSSTDPRYLYTDQKLDRIIALLERLVEMETRADNIRRGIR